nr:IclR family transcriptional regulator C-terminal domain-containing protein [Paenibacillus sp. MMS18-CY102]
MAPIRLAASPGIRLPAHATALGKVLLASLDGAALDLLLQEEQLGASSTPYTITSRERLLEQLETVRAEGIAEDSQEAVLGICCAAAPVRDPSGRVVAAISCSMSVFEWANRREEIRQAVIATAARISG